MILNVEDETYNAVCHGKRCMEAKDLVYDGVKVMQTRPVRELFPSRVKVRVLLLELFPEARLRFRLPA